MAETEATITYFDDGGFADLKNSLPGTFKNEDIEVYGDEGLAVTTARFGTVQFPGDEEVKPCLWFKETRKKLVMSNYRMDMLEDILLSLGVELTDKEKTRELLQGGMKLILKMDNWTTRRGKRQYGIGLVLKED